MRQEIETYKGYSIAMDHVKVGSTSSFVIRVDITNIASKAIFDAFEEQFNSTAPLNAAVYMWDVAVRRINSYLEREQELKN